MNGGNVKRIEAMAKAQSQTQDLPLAWSRRFTLEARRFNAWWEGYAFDAAAERAALAGEQMAEQAPAGPPEQDLATLIWGEGRLEPGDAAWTMRQARTLGLALKADLVVLGAGTGGPLADLRRGTRWKVSGYSRIASQIKGMDVIPYEAALTRINRASADGGLSFFELHRDADPAMMGMFAAELVKPGGPFSFVDFAVARRGARLKTCFAEPWAGSPRPAEQLVELLDKAGFRLVDTVDETRAFLPLVTRGWARWRTAYAHALDYPDPRARADYVSLLARYANLWAERFDAIKAGQLQVVRLQTRRKG